MLSVGCIRTVHFQTPAWGHQRGWRGGCSRGICSWPSAFGETEEAVPCPLRPASERQSQAHVPHHTVNCAFLPPQVISLTQPGVSLCPKA